MMMVILYPDDDYDVDDYAKSKPKYVEKYTK